MVRKSKKKTETTERNRIENFEEKRTETKEYLHPKAAIRKKLETLILNLLDGALGDQLDFANLTTKAAVARIAVDYLKLEGGEDEIPSIFADLQLQQDFSEKLESEIEDIKTELEDVKE